MKNLSLSQRAEAQSRVTSNAAEQRVPTSPKVSDSASVVSVSDALQVVSPMPSASTPISPKQKVQEALQPGSKVAEVAEPFKKLICPNTLRLERKDGATTVIPSHNYYLGSDGKPRKYVRRLVQEALTRDPKTQAALNESLREAYARYEMSFRTKNHETGAYDKIFKVPVNGFIAPIAEKQYTGLVDSSKSVMRAFRGLLQKIYSAETIDAESLGITHLPAEDQVQILSAITESIYLEPSVAGPEMRDYPFLAVGGFDAAVGNLDKMDPVFFEVNLGTPSGLSNNYQLMQLLSEVDPKLFNTIRHNLPEDRTFEILREAIESNALCWTGNDKGISVVVSPGVYNGAHPDVASISMFSGMPLVRPQDLYQDAAGWIRLNTGDPESDPVVTGIYGRAEESFFLQNNEDGIYMKTPAFADPRELERKLGVELQPGVLYNFVYDSDGDIIDVKKDKDGKPVPQTAFDRIGLDPGRPTAGEGSFLRAIKSRKLYYSALGGRTVDDKRIFQAVSQYLAPGYRRDSDNPVPTDRIAHPPRTLKLEEYDTFYNDPDLHNYVVKEPDRSGGDGVYLLVNLTQEEREDVVRQVKANPSHFIVQQFAEFALMMTPELDSDGVTLAYGSQANDWRLFIVMDGEGNVDAGPNSLLLRTAETGSASTNTSQGGGYGIGVVLSETPRIRPLNAEPLVSVVKTPHVGAGRKQALLSLIDELNELTLRSAPGSLAVVPRDGSLSFLAHKQRELMDLLGREMAGLMSVLRDYDDGEISQTELHESLLSYRQTLYDHTTRPVSGLEKEVEARLAKLEKVDQRYSKAEIANLGLKSLRKKLVQTTSLPEGPVVVRCTHHGDKKTVLSEVARYTESRDPALQRMLDTASRYGAEVRLFRSDARADERVGQAFVNPYFRVSDAGKPIIGIDLSQDFSLPALAHELEHLKHWLELKQEVRKDDSTLSDLEVGTEATRRALEPAMRVVGERRSLNAEIRVEDTIDSPFNRGLTPRARDFRDDGYVARLAYPEIEGVRDLLHRAIWSKEELNTALLDKFLDDAITIAEANQAQLLEHYQSALGQFEASEDGMESEEAQRTLYLAKRCAEQNLFSELFRYDLNRFVADGTSSLLGEAFEAAAQRRGIKHSPVRLPSDFSFNQQMQEQEQ